MILLPINIYLTPNRHGGDIATNKLWNNLRNCIKYHMGPSSMVHNNSIVFCLISKNYYLLQKFNRPFCDGRTICTK